MHHGDVGVTKRRHDLDLAAHAHQVLFRFDLVLADRLDGILQQQVHHGMMLRVETSRADVTACENQSR